MLVLEATSNRQGERPDDYHWCRDGELAYNQGFDCARPDCGCERGWAGLDSRRATTTVQVVERPDMTVHDLAVALASSLHEGGWINSPDASDELVARYVDEIIEMANFFGEGAVLERDGMWARARDGSTEAIDPLNRATIEDMTEDALVGGPMATLARAVALLHRAEPYPELLIDALAQADWPDAQALGCAIDWLANSKLTQEWHDVPDWLAHLDEAEVVEARRCRGDDGDAYLVALALDDHELGTVSFFVKTEGHLDSLFAIPDSISTYVQLMKLMQGRRYKAFRKIAFVTARRALINALASQGDAALALGAEDEPSARPLGDFLVDHIRW